MDQALLESNLLAIGSTQDDSQVAVSNGCYFYYRISMAVNSKPGFVPEVDIPFDEVDPVVFGQPLMQVKMVFKMPDHRSRSNFRSC